MVMMPVTTSGMNALPMNLIGHGTAVNNTVRQIASSMGTAVLISVLSNVTKNVMPSDSLKTSNPISYGQKAIDAVLSGYHATFLLAAIIALVAVFIAFTLKDKRAQKAVNGGEE
jgi:hypothetical protein